MTSIRLFEGVDIALRAEPAGLRIVRKGPFPTTRNPVELSIAVDAGILLEQDLAWLDGDHVLLHWSEWPAAVSFGTESLTAFTVPSHHLLQVDRRGELGRADFRFVTRWLEGSREVSLSRVGAYLRHPATDRLFHLDPRTLELLEAIDAFDAIPSDEATRGAQVWAVLQKVLQRGDEVGAELDSHLAGQVVLAPSILGLAVREDGGEGVVFTPTLPGSPDSARFEASFEKHPRATPVITFEREDGIRVRVLLTPDQEEALRRMQQVRTLRGAEATAAAKNPASIFDGVAGVVDLSNITRTYGPRVIGIGPLEGSSNVGAPREGRSVLSGMEADGMVAPPTSPDSAPELASVTVEIIDAETGLSTPLPIRSSEVESLRAKLVEALAKGQDSVAFGGIRMVAEWALVQVLERHVTGDGAPSEAGETGHLYLLINDHESTLTAALQTDLPGGCSESEPPLRRPDSLLPQVDLQPHQCDGVRWLDGCRALSGRRGAVLADDMGLGKTLQLLVHIANQVETGAMVETGGTRGNGPWRPVLVVAPLFLVETGVWTEEMGRRFADDGRIFQPWVVLRDQGLAKVRMTGGGRDGLGKVLLDPEKLMAHKVVITNYETMVAYQHSLAQLIDGRPMWSMVIFDEAQEVKSPGTKNSYAAKALDAAFRVAATGTPVETRLRDLWNLVDTVEPTVLGTQRDFVGRFERPAMNGTEEQREAALRALRGTLGYARPGALLLRRDKSVLRNLPERLDHPIKCALTETERTTMQRILAGMRAKAGKGSALSALQQLHLASQHPLLVGKASTPATTDELLRTSSRLKALVETLRSVEARNEKALVFARSKEAQHLLARVLRGVFMRDVEIVNGDTGLGPAGGRAGAGARRKEILQRFRESTGFDVIVLSPFVAGVGLTLVEANHVLHYGRWWNPAVENQATDRAYRLGQRRPVHVYSFIGVDTTGSIPRTLDQAVEELLQERRKLARDFLLPTSEVEEARNVIARLTGAGTSDEPVRIPGQVAQSSAEIAALVVEMSRQDGHSAAWLGSEGLFGIHLIRQTTHGVEGVRIVDQEMSEDWQLLRDGAERWQARLGAGSMGTSLLARVPLPGAGSRRWSDVEREAEQAKVAFGIAAVPLVPCRTVPEVRMALG